MGKRKREKRKQRKRLIKQIEGVKFQKEKHLEKIRTENPIKETTKEYWIEEVERFRLIGEEKKEKLDKLK